MEQNLIIPDDGISLSAVLETPEGAEGKLPLVIILHGFGSAKNRIHTLQTAETMREAGFATLRLDLFGHGESGGSCIFPAIPRAAWWPRWRAPWNRTGSAGSSCGRRAS